MAMQVLAGSVQPTRNAAARGLPPMNLGVGHRLRKNDIAGRVSARPLNDLLGQHEILARASNTQAEPITSTSKAGQDDAVFEEQRLSTQNGTFAKPLGTSWASPQGLKLGKIFAGTVAIAAIASMSSSILQNVESVPLLGDVEALVGVLVTAKISFTWLLGGEGRARIECFLEDLAERIKGAKGLNDVDFEEPSMLDVQLESLLKEHLATTPGSEAEGGGVRVHNRQALVVSLKNFLLSREMKARRISSVLRSDLAVLTDEKKSLKEQLEKALAENKAMAAELDSALDLKATAEEERAMATSQASSLSGQWGQMNSQLENLSFDKSRLEQLQNQLEAELREALFESEAVRDQAKAMEVKEADARQALARERVAHADELAAREREFEHQMAELRDSASAVFASNQRMAERIQALEGAQATAEEAVKTLRLDFDDAVEDAVADAVAIRTEELAKESEKAMAKAEAVTKMMRSKLEMLEVECGQLKQLIRELEGDVQDLETDKEGKMQRIHFLEKELHATQHARDESDLWAQKIKTELEHTHNDFSDKIMESQQELESLKALWQDTEKRAMEAEVRAAEANTEVEKLRQAYSHGMGTDAALAVLTETPKKLTKATSPTRGRKRRGMVEGEEEAAPAMPAADELALPADVSSPPSPVGSDVASPDDLASPPVSPRRGRKDKMGSGDSSGVSEERLDEIKAHARSVRDQFVDIAKPLKEQEEGLEAYIQELVTMGASHEWSKTYIQRNFAYARSKANKTK